jgi:hypothetical protein
MYLTLLRTSFPPTIALIVLGIYFFVIDNRLSWKRSALVVTVCSLVPITAIYTKNLILYDFWGSSSFAPLNMMKGFDVPVQPNYFPTPEQIKQAHPDLLCEHSYRFIDRAIFKHDGGPNYNSCYWLAFAKAHKSTAWSEYAFKPHAWRVVSHLAKYFSLPDKYQFISNRTNITQYADTFNTIFLPWPMREGYTVRMSIFLLLLLMPWLLYRYPDKRLISLYAVVAIHMASHVLTDGDESDRFVFDIEFCLYIFAAYAGAMLMLKKESRTPVASVS